MPQSFIHIVAQELRYLFIRFCRKVGRVDTSGRLVWVMVSTLNINISVISELLRFQSTILFCEGKVI